LISLKFDKCQIIEIKNRRIVFELPVAISVGGSLIESLFWQAKVNSNHS